MTVSVSWLDSGDAGVGETFAKMRNLANSGQTDPVVVTVARNLARETGSRSPERWALAVRAWLVKVWIYVDDPVDTELLISPRRMLAEYVATGQITGDCDEAATMGAALGKAIGIPATFTALAFADPSDTPGRLAHVFATLLPADGNGVTLDVTKPDGPLANVTRAVTVDV